MFVSMQMYCHALKKRKGVIDLASHKSIDYTLKKALTRSPALERYITEQLNKEPRGIGRTYSLKPWHPKKAFGYGAFDDRDLSLSLGHLTINIEVEIIDATEDEYTCNVSLDMDDIYDFASFGPEHKASVRLINNYLGYMPQQKGWLHPYEWCYSCSFTKKYRRRQS